jgi:2-iminobutanoate/2-iminopropanoate deaminase
MTKDDYLTKDFRMRYILLTLLLFNINLYSQTNMKKIINTLNAPAPIGPYNQAILIDNTLYVSGQIALDSKSMKMINGTIEEETKKVMQNIQAILLEVNFSFENVIKTTIFIKDMNDFSKINSIYGEYFDEKTRNNCKCNQFQNHLFQV